MKLKGGSCYFPKMEEWLIIYLIVVLAVLAFFALYLFSELVLNGNDPGHKRVSLDVLG